MSNAQGNVLKLKGIVNVKAFGAKGDGTTDDRAAIQSAINTGGEIYFPPGTYRVSSTLTLVDGVTLKGAGRGVVTIQKDNYNGAAITGTDVDSVEISDLSIVGPGQWTGTGNKGIVIAVASQELCTTIAIRRVTISACNDICLYMGTCSFVSYDNVRCRDYGFCGIFIDGGDGHSLQACSTRMGLVGYLINQTAGYGPTTATLTACYAEQHGQGIVFKGAVACAAIGCGVEAAINYDATYNGTNWIIDGGDNVALYNCLSRNDTIGAVIAAPHVLVKGSATRVLIDGFRRDNSATYAAPTWEIDAIAATSVLLGRHNFTGGTIRSSSKISTFTTSVVA